ncbi:MAG TPA: peptidoglycan DD-metalloendopeptidase family protein [Solirubrobacterales bacterium]|jgi:murein DD-endopeptidase MepM/ murein hydrolase activator NlpD|nr:peptidoglycan DD-metalloendopeptidase family protein [Solirubrobacterales bacterium]
MSDSGPKRTRTHRRHKAGGALVIAVAAVSLAVGAAAPAQDLEGELDTKQSELDQAQAKRGVLSTEIERYSSKISQLEGEVATLRNREALVQQELEEKQAQLDRERHHLQVLRERLDKSVKLLEERLVAIYKSERPDALTVILEADGFSDLIERYEYLNQIEQRDSDIVDRVRDLRNATKDTVQRIRAARNEIAAKKRELTRTRVALEAREAELSAARANRQDTLSEIDSNIKRLEGDIGDLEGQIQQQLQASAAPTLPAGPVRGGSSGMIWPVDGPISSPFGMRWGRLHAGIDISVPAGTPIRAAKAGSVALAAPTGGYGNYTCIDHGGGLSTCYAHQSRFAVTSGSVSQGQVIGYVGCTGSCYGDHLHFEVRVNGSPTDPLGYL